MTPTERARLDRTIHGLIAEFGPWAVLWRSTVMLKPAFLAADAAAKKPPKQPRRKKPPAEPCGICSNPTCDDPNGKH